MRGILLGQEFARRERKYMERTESTISHLVKCAPSISTCKISTSYLNVDIFIKMHILKIVK
jgi:hypothetical protein